MTDLANGEGIHAGAPMPRAPSLVERCAATGITKPECHCPACLAAMLARHGRSGGAPRA